MNYRWHAISPELRDIIMHSFRKSMITMTDAESNVVLAELTKLGA